MVSQYGTKLAVHFITNHFGNIVAKVCERLLCNGPLNLEQLIRYTELTAKDVKNSLLVLIQHNCVQAFLLEGVDEDASKVRTQYLALFDNIIHRLRFPKFIDIVSRELDNKCVYLLEGLLRDGRLTLKQMIDRASQGKENAVATDVRESLRKLLDARYVERCPAREVTVSTESAEETASRKRGPKSAKVFVAPKTLEQRVIEAAVPKEVIRFSLTADTGRNADTEANSDDYKMISVEVDVAKEERTLWRANFEEFIRYLRHKALIENVRARMDDGVATVLRAILEAKKSAEEKVKIEKSAPLSLDTIFAEVINTENGRTMTKDRVEASLVQLGCPPLDDQKIIDLKGIIQWARNEEVESIVLKRYGMDAYRMFRHLSKEDMFCPTDTIAESTLVEKKDAPNLLLKLWKDNYLYMEKIPVSMAGSRPTLISLWKVNKPQIWGFVLDEMFHAALNLSLRMAFEQEKGEEVLNVHQDKLQGPLLQKYKRLKNGMLLLGSSLMKLDDALMLFHDF